MNELIKIFIIFGLILSIKCDQECSKTICYPTAGDLLIGRESMLRASSTCGLESKQVYCVVTLTDRGRDSKCSICDSKDPYNMNFSPNSHRIENIVSRLPQNSERWWQSSNGIHNVSIEVEFVTEFQFIFTQLRFKTYRPAAMYIERSKDYGRSWQISAYFSDNCARDFPNVPERKRNDIAEVSCTSEFSSISPSEEGIVLFVATPSDLHTNDKNWIEKKNEITAITNLRVQFVRLHTFGDWKIDNNPNILNKYYYAISEWIIRGRCSCYGHADKCQPKNGQKYLKEMVYGVCVCQHNTIGQHCEKCKDFFNDRPWMPAENNSTNECKKCQCNNHSTTCHFDSVLFDASGKKSGGKCDNCLHNTEGVNCERCNSGYYRNSNVTISAIDTCLKCKCDNNGTKYHGVCNQETESDQNIVAGSCTCKANVEGFHCDKCKTGFWKFDSENENGCTKCDCLMSGTINNEGCHSSTGLCSCKPFVEGQLCNYCKDGYYNISSSNTLGCTQCACNKQGSLDYDKCDKSSGQCKCKQGYMGLTCTDIKRGWYTELPRYPLKFNENTQLILPPVSKTGLYNFIVTFDTSQLIILDSYVVMLTIDHSVKSACPNYQDTFPIGKDSKIIVVPNKCLEKDLPIVLTVFLILEPIIGSKPPPIIDVAVIPMVSPNNTATRSALNECLKYPPTSMPERCNFMKAEINSRLIGTEDPKTCNCNVTGSRNNICDQFGGQCQCLSNVVGRQCNQCKLNSYGFDARGCKNCDCEPSGSLNLQCAHDTGKCLCRVGVEGRQCDNCKNGFWKFPFCEACKCHSMTDKCNEKSGECIDCRGNSMGANCQQCEQGYYGDPSINIPCHKCQCPGLSWNLNHGTGCTLIFNTSYVCHCKPGYKGQFCNECDENYFGNAREKNGSCSPCLCSSNIDRTIAGNCDPKTGECKKCLYHTSGFNCDKCAPGYFGNGISQTCKKCVCNKFGTNSTVSEICDHKTGKCPCLPNVIGQQCDQCQSKFYNISSGKGCMSCECDSSNGAIVEICNSLTGQCQCRQSRGGRQCDKCLDGYWGDPRQPLGCKVCLCNFEGSLFNQCDRNNGACRCKPGIVGKSCDKCARGTDGQMPNCSPCGDCWEQWDKTITEIFISLGEHLNGSMGNVTLVGVPQSLYFLLNSLRQNVDRLKATLQSVPDDLVTQIERLELTISQLKIQSQSLDSVTFNRTEFDIDNVTKAVANIKELVSSYKIQDIQGAHDVIVQSLRSIVDAVTATTEAMRVLKQMENSTMNQDTKMKSMNLDKMEAKSKELANLETVFVVNLNKFNLWTCNAGSENKSLLCSDACRGVGCGSNGCSRAGHINKQCYIDGQPSFFNAYALKMGGRNIPENNFEEEGKNLLKKLNITLGTVDIDINSAKELAVLSESTVNYKYEKVVKWFEILNNTIYSLVSEEEFRKISKAINNFKLLSHESEIKEIENNIKTRIQQLQDRAKEVLAKSSENRNECDRLKNNARDAKVKTNNLLKSIKNLEDSHKRALDIQSKTKSIILNFNSDEAEIMREIDKIQKRQRETENNHNNIDGELLKLTQLNNDIQKARDASINELHLLKRDQENITKQLEDIQLRTEKSIKKRDSLTADDGSVKTKVIDRRQPLLEKIKEFNKMIEKARERVSNARQVVAKRQNDIIRLSERAEEKLQRISSLEYELHTKAEYQESCLP